MEIFKTITEHEYREHEALNQSTLKLIFKSKKHALADYKLRTKTPAMIFGSAFHDMLLMGEDYFMSNYEVCEKGQRKKDKFKTRILNFDYFKIRGMVKHLNQYEIGDRMPHMLKEQSIFWNMRGLSCKARLDLVDIEKCELLDIKTFSLTDELKKPSQEIFWTILRRKYHFQLAFYLMGLKELTGKDWKAKVIFIEKSSPYQFTYVEVPPMLMEKGERDVLYALDVFTSPFDPCGEDNYPKVGEVLEIPESYKEYM